MAFTYTGTSTILNGSISIYPDGASSSITFDITKQPLNLPFVTGNGPSTIIGNPVSFTVTGTDANGNHNQTIKYDTSFSYNPATFEITVSFIKDPTPSNANAPDIMPSDSTSTTLTFAFLYPSI